MGALKRFLVAGVAVVLTAESVIAQTSIAAARDLYASASYEEALAALRGVRQGAAPDVARQADEYIAFCLFALGRTEEAESAAEAVIRRSPLARIDARDASPRIESMFTQVRTRLLPGLIRDAFRAARDTMVQGDAAKGAQQLGQVRVMLDAATSLNAWDESLSDLAVLVDGFLELNRAATTERPPAAPAAAPAAAPPAAPPAAPLAAALGAPESEALPAPVAGGRPTAAVSRPTTYSGADVDVTAPIAVRQDMPTMFVNANSRGKKRTGVIAVTIDEHGIVRDAVMRTSISAAIDAQLVEAAGSWRYQPARKAGAPVRYVKIIGVSIAN